MVDDRPDNLLALEAVLSHPEYHLVKASSGSEALSLLLQWNFALILLDVQMPDMDGFETVSWIRQNERFKQIPVILITAINKEMSHIHRGYKEGVADYLFKPFDPEILRAKVAVFADLYRKNLTIKEQARLLLESERRERERRLTELELENLRRYRSLADAIPHIVLKFQFDGIADYFNRFWTHYTGLTLEQSLGRGWQTAIHPEDLASFLETWKQARMNGEGDFEIECRIRRLTDGTYRWHLVRIVKETQLGGELVGWLGTCTEIHERKQAAERMEQEQELLEQAVESRTRELIRAQKDILEISEKEQKRIGQDLHDGLAQQLAGISFKSKILQQKLDKKAPQEAGEAYEILDLLKKAIGETKRLARGFYPIELERHGLYSALQELVINTEKMFNITCVCRWDAVKLEDRGMECHIYRIVQEALHNAIKHGKAKRVTVCGTQKENTIEVTVEDDGKGLPDQDEIFQGMGLRTMQYRSRMIGASFKIERMAQGGTCVKIILQIPGIAEKQCREQEAII